MSSAGHVQNMISTMKRNRAALKSKQAKFRGKRIFKIQYGKSGQMIPEMKISFEEMKLIKEEIRNEIRSENIIRWRKIGLLIAIIVGAGSYLFFLFVRL